MIALITRKMNRLTMEDYIINTTCTILAAIVLLATLYPFYYCLINSFNIGTDAQKGGIYFFPRQFTLDNYKIVFEYNTLAQTFMMTVLRTILGTATGIFFTAMVAYGLSQKHLLFRKTYSILGIITMYFSGGLIPYYLLLNKIGLINNFLVYIIPALYSVFNALLFMAFFRDIPESLKESARLDGANDFYIFLKVILPVSKPVLATLALFVGVGHWNDWFAPAFFMTNEKMITLPVLLIRMVADTETQQKLNDAVTLSGGQMRSVTLEAVRFATMIIAVFPITLVYPFIQKYFVQGMMVGAIKA